MSGEAEQLRNVIYMAMNSIELGHPSLAADQLRAAYYAPPVETPPKIVQINMNSEDLVVLLDSGELWGFNKGNWVRIRLPPPCKGS